MLLLVLISVIHILIDCYKRRTSNSILPLYTVPIQEPPQPPPQPSALMLNTMKYNPDILNWKVALGTIFMVPILLFWYFVIQLKYAPLHLIINIVVCFYVPLLFCSLNSKLRSFIIKCFKWSKSVDVLMVKKIKYWIFLVFAYLVYLIIFHRSLVLTLGMFKIPRC